MPHIRYRYGKIGIIDGDPVISRSLELYGEWAQAEIDALSLFIKPGDVVLDVGSFLGTHAIAFSKMVGSSGHVYCFEPRPEIFSRLQENLSLNDCTNVTARMEAVASSIGVVKVDALDLNEATNFGGLSLQATSQAARGDRLIDTRTIDSLCLERVDLIKIDVEGMEPDVLEGAERTAAESNPVFAVECNSLTVGAKILHFAERSNYTVYGLLFDAYNTDNYLGNTTNVFGIAKEISLILAPASCSASLLESARELALYEIQDLDSLALLLLHKPQYEIEVLKKTKLGAHCGTDFSTIYSRKCTEELARQMQRLRESEEAQGRLATAIDELGSAKKELSSQLQRSLAENQSLIAIAAQREQDYRDAAAQISELAATAAKYRKEIERLASSNELDTARQQLSQVLQSRSWRITSPLRTIGQAARKLSIFPADARSKARENQLQRQRQWAELMYQPRRSDSAATRGVIDVIIPVYRGIDETRLCIESVLSAKCNTRYELIVIDDCSPERELSDWLCAQAALNRFTLLRNDTNLGFVGTVNRGMSLHHDRDVLLLNSDAVVANDWLDRMCAPADADAEVGTVTPFSNNATICSYPNFCKDNSMPPGLSLELLDQMFAQVNSRHALEIPTGVGFCFFIKRRLLNAIGFFDIEKFGKGYGEENDFCLRAIAAGYMNVLACDTYVQHLGAVSFADSSNPGKARAMEILRELHPSYEPDVHDFIDRDPIAKYRHAVDLARLRCGEKPVILHISHSRGGGTQRHIEEIAALTHGKAENLLLRPLSESAAVELQWINTGEAFKAIFSLEKDLQNLIKTLELIRLAFIHVHHTIGVPTEVLNLPQKLNVPYKFTIHDYYSICPQISLTGNNDKYCGENGVSQCKKCLMAVGKADDITEWRQNYRRYLSRAEKVIAPSEDVKSRLNRYFSNLEVSVIRHPELGADNGIEVQTPSPRTPDASIKVVVMGALSKIKGADKLEAAVLDAHTRSLPINFVLIGYAYRELATDAPERLKVTGAYVESRLPEILSQEAPDLIWFPAVWPETYSYTLSAAIEGGYAIAAPDLGAFRERLVSHEACYILPWDLPAEQFNDWVLKLFNSDIAPNKVTLRNSITGVDKYYTESYLSSSDKKKSATNINYGEFLSHSALLTELRPVPTLGGKVIRTLRTLRSHPRLAWLAKRIPHNLQRRIRDRLSP